MIHANDPAADDATPDVTDDVQRDAPRRPRLTRIDLNVDAGEAFGRWTLQDDAALVGLASSVNVACGFHAGDPLTMHTTVRAALAAGTAIGAHPGYPDLRGFGRRAVAMEARELAADVIYQVGALAAIVEAEGGALAHVKPHGALYTTMADDASVAWTVVRAVASVSADLPLMVQAGTVAEDVAAEASIPHIAEAFGDRGYASDGRLLPRRHPRALLHDANEVLAHLQQWITTGTVRTVDGTDVPIAAETLCLHGDAPGAVHRLEVVRDALQRWGVEVAPATPRLA